MKTKMMIISIVATVLISMSLLTACGTGDGSRVTEDHEENLPAESSPLIRYERHLMTFASDGKISIFVDDAHFPDAVHGASTTHEQRSLDGSVMAFTTDENVLYVTDGGTLTKVSEDVDPFQFHLSVSGAGLVYHTGENGQLRHYDVSNGADVFVAEGSSSYHAALSPDGRTLAYIQKGDDGSALMLFDGGQSRKLAEGDMSLLGLSDRGAYIYTVHGTLDDGLLYCYDSEGASRMIGRIDADLTLRYNADHTQIMFGHEGETYVSEYGQEAHKVSGDLLELVVPQNCGSHLEHHYTTYPVKDLYGQVYTTQDGHVWQIQRDDGSVKLLSKATKVSLDPSCGYVYYIYDGEELRRAAISDGEKASQTCKTIVDGDVSAYAVTSGGDRVYYIDGDTLYSESGDGRTEIFADVDIGHLAISAEDVVCFLSDGDAYVYTDGKTPSGVGRDTVYFVSSPNGFVYGRTEDGSYFLPVREMLVQDGAYQELVEMRERIT